MQSIYVASSVILATHLRNGASKCIKAIFPCGAHFIALGKPEGFFIAYFSLLGAGAAPQPAMQLAMSLTRPMLLITTVVSPSQGLPLASKPL